LKRIVKFYELFNEKFTNWIGHNDGMTDTDVYIEKHKPRYISSDDSLFDVLSGHFSFLEELFAHTINTYESLQYHYTNKTFKELNKIYPYWNDSKDFKQNIRAFMTNDAFLSSPKYCDLYLLLNIFDNDEFCEKDKTLDIYYDHIRYGNNNLSYFIVDKEYEKDIYQMYKENNKSKKASDLGIVIDMSKETYDKYLKTIYSYTEEFTYDYYLYQEMLGIIKMKYSGGLATIIKEDVSKLKKEISNIYNNQRILYMKDREMLADILTIYINQIKTPYNVL